MDRLNKEIFINNLDIEKAKLKFFGEYILEEMIEYYFDKAKFKKSLDILSDKETDETIEYILNKYHWNNILEYLKEPHQGDCTASSHTCMRCYAEGFFNISTVNWSKQEGAKLLALKFKK